MGKLYHSGDVVYSNGQPFVYALCADQRVKRCDCCFSKLPEKLLQCLDCRFVRYCSSKCQSESMDLHRPECLVMAQRPLQTITRLILRCLIKLDNTNTELMDCIHGHQRTWSCLMDHHDDIIHDVDTMLTFGHVIEELELTFQKNLVVEDVGRILRIYGKILINSFAVSEPDTGLIIGRALYLGASIFDHSCRPDLFYQFDGLRIYFIVANEDIVVEQSKSGVKDSFGKDINQLHISYIDELMPVQERQTALKTTYYFECQCSRCQEDLEQENFYVQPSSLARRLSRCLEMIDDYFHSNEICDLITTIVDHVVGRNFDVEKLFVSHRIHPVRIRKQRESFQQILEECQELIQDADIMDQGPKILVQDFLASHRCDPFEMEQLAQHYVRYYGSRNHPRLLHRLWFWIACLLVNDDQMDKHLNQTKINAIRAMLRQIRLMRKFLKNF